MLTIFDCVLTLLLTITPQFTQSSVAYATFKGSCLRYGELALKFDKTHEILIIETSSMLYTLPLPTEEGHYEMTYWMGQGDVWVIPGGTFPVIIGSRGFL